MTEKSLKELNKVVQLAKKGTDLSVVTVAIPLDRLEVISFGDSSWNNLSGGKAQGDGAGKGATARRVDRGAGGKGANRVIASEFREAMESYFKNVEAGE